jgi:branched-chain amino acid transport system ATP-binding protein
LPGLDPGIHAFTTWAEAKGVGRRTKPGDERKCTVAVGTAAMMLEVSRLCAFYGPSQALHGLDFAIAEGGVVTLLGANGAGKTTTLRALCGMVRMTGEIRFDGAPITGKATEDIVRLGIAHVPEARGTFVRMTVEENLRLGAMTRRDHAAITEDIEEIYTLFPRLKERRRQQAGTLSGGEQQMLAVGRGLMLRPRLMLLDEPSFGLAPLIVAELFAILGRLNRERRVAMLIVEQNAALALDLAQEAYLLETGRIVMAGPAKDIAADEAVRRSYLGY